MTTDMLSADRTEIARLFEAARRAVDEERKRIDEEIRAFRAFRERAESAQPQPAGGGQRPPLQTQTVSGPASGATRIETAYRETVMAVSHYEAEYGDTYEESLREELTPEVATALTRGAAFDYACKQATVAAAREAVHKRQLLREGLETEHESIETGEHTLVPIAEQLEDYRADTPAKIDDSTRDGYLRRLSLLEERCERLVDQRQETRVAQRNRLRLSRGCPDVAYVYRELDVDYPLVAATATLVDEIQRLRHRFR